jgi:hypothetical protein
LERCGRARVGYLGATGGSFPLGLWGILGDEKVIILRVISGIREDGVISFPKEL